MSKKTKSQKQKHKVIQTKKRSIIKPLILGIFTCVGFIASIVVFLPRPMVSPPSVPFVTNDPFSVTFDIYNNGFIPLHNCEVYLGIGQITGESKKLDPLFIPTFESRFVMPAWQHHKLGIDERFTLVLSDLMNGVGSADIAIIVSYNPWFIPIRKEKIFRFITFKQKSSIIYWRSWPTNRLLPIIK